MPLIEILEDNVETVNQNDGVNNHLLIEEMNEESSGIQYHLFSC